MNVSRATNWTLGSGLIGWAVFTFFTPSVIKALFTPPVSFGTNCEPAADWSMTKLISTQFIGIIIFMILGLFMYFFMKKRAERKAEAAKNSAK